jgi:hypothetical protein
MEATDKYTGEPDWLSTVDVIAPLATAKYKWPIHYASAYAAAARDAIKENRAEQGIVYRFMQGLFEIYPKFDSKSEPYERHGGMCWLPSDFTDNDHTIIRELVKRSDDAAYRAHLLDILFESKAKDGRAAAEAAPLFLEVGIALSPTNEADRMDDAFRRAIQLARRTGWRKELGERIRAGIIEHVLSLAIEPHGYALYIGLEVVHEAALGDAKEWREMARTAARYHEEKGDEDYVQRYLTLVERFSRSIPEPDAEHEALRLIGESYVRQGQKRTEGRSGSYMAAEMFLKKGITALQRGKAPADRITQVQALMREYQGKIQDELGRVGESIDVSDLFKQKIEAVKDKTFFDVLKVLLFGSALLEPEKLREEVMAEARAHSFLHLFQTSILDSEGRTREILKGLFDLQGEELEAELKKRMLHRAQHHWKWRGQTHIIPIWQQLREDHTIRKEDLIWLVTHNPWIPPGHELMILRGLQAGFDGDFLVAGHLLTLQFEACVRHALASAGAHIAMLEQDGTEMLKTWGGLMSHPMAAQLFGPELLFEMSGLMFEESGYNLRHKVAHGMLKADEFDNFGTLNIWWLMLYLCFIPVGSREELPVVTTVDASSTEESSN